MCLAQLVDSVDQLGISPGSHRRRRPARKRPYRGGRCKQGKTILAIVTDRSRPQILHPLCTSTHDTIWLLTDKSGTAYAILYSNPVKIDTGPFIQEFSKHFKVMFLNTQTIRNKALDICNYIMQASVDLVFLCEIWLRLEGDEADCAALTPPGFCLKSLPRQSGTGGGLAVLHRTSLTATPTKWKWRFLHEILFLRLLRYVKWVFPIMVILQCYLVFTVSHLVDRTS